MKFQALKAAAVGAATALAASCATVPGHQSAPHASAPAMPTAFSRLALARDYRAEQAIPFDVSADAEPSFALPHEIHPNGVPAAGAHAGSAAIGTPAGLSLRVASNPPAGWAISGDQAIRHAKSGLECPLSIEIEDENRRFMLQRVLAFDQKNLDVGCAYETGSGAYITLYASYWPQMPVEESASGAVVAIGQRFDVKGLLSVPVIQFEADGPSPLFDGLETPLAAGFDIGEVNGTPYKTSLWIVKTYGWHVKVRGTYPQGDQTSEIVSAISFAFSHLGVRAKNMEDPVTEGGEV